VASYFLDPRADETFNLSGDVIVHLCGDGGQMVRRLHQRGDLGVVSSTSPAVVILKMGTNDLSGLRPEVVGSEGVGFFVVTILLCLSKQSVRGDTSC